MASNLDGVNLKIVSCTRCDRLVRYCQEISSTKKRMYINEDYWGKPVPSLGNHDAEVLIIGLAPAAHGANRTGRMFTGDMSGAWLFRTLNKYGFSNSPDSFNKNDGFFHDYELDLTYSAGTGSFGDIFIAISEIELIGGGGDDGEYIGLGLS